jgi:hypothetical protein
MWSVLDLFPFHVMTHFTVKNTEKIIRKKNIQNRSNTSDSIMTPNQMKTGVRTISQNNMNTKYNQITVNTKCAYVKQFYYSVTQFVWTTFLSTVEKHPPCSCSCPSASDMHCMMTVSHPAQYNHKPFWSPVQTSLLNILIFLPNKSDTQILWDMTLRNMVNS